MNFFDFKQQFSPYQIVNDQNCIKEIEYLQK
jgi:hypothetical protein